MTSEGAPHECFPRGLEWVTSPPMAEAQDIQRVVEEIAAHVRRSIPGSRAGGEARTSTARIPPESIRSNADLAPYIDHTLLKPEATREDVVRVAREAVEHGFATVCVNSCHVATVAGILAGSRSVPIAVVGFPLGAALSSAKAFEAREAIAAGAREIDMVISIGALKARDYTLVLEDIARVVEASRPYPVKVILETSLLDPGREDRRLRAVQGGGRGLREDVHGLQHRRRHRGGHRAHASTGGR